MEQVQLSTTFMQWTLQNSFSSSLFCFQGQWVVGCTGVRCSLLDKRKAMYSSFTLERCKSWAIEKAEQRRIDAFKPWCWRRLLRVPWTARRSNQSILKEINPEIFIGRTDADAEAETPILRPPDVKSPLTGKYPDAGKK